MVLGRHESHAIRWSVFQRDLPIILRKGDGGDTDSSGIVGQLLVPVQAREGVSNGLEEGFDKMRDNILEHPGDLHQSLSERSVHCLGSGGAPPYERSVVALKPGEGIGTGLKHVENSSTSGIVPEDHKSQGSRSAFDITYLEGRSGFGALAPMSTTSRECQLIIIGKEGSPGKKAATTIPVQSSAFDIELNSQASVGSIGLDRHSEYVRVGNHLLESLESHIEHIPHPTNEINTPWHRCKTEPDSISSIYLHVKSPGKVHRWKPGSTITFNVNCESFPEPAYTSHAIECLETAANEWNKGDLGVRFERVADSEPAVFQLMYSAPCRYRPAQLADSFFPGDPRHQQRLCVYEVAFGKESHGWMANVFCHELGHILGLRHEFARERELGSPAMLLGESNGSSIMNYFDELGKMGIQKSDYDGVKRFYQPDIKEYDGYTIVNEKPRCFALPPPAPLSFPPIGFNATRPSSHRRSWSK
ncbi:hypothetical protein F5Y04DRAFT_227186 [Hypomontagnella monticulosa]|nr:hypothetical protein F5Y04DRAFT_227186 [Hypomontagnella monticulosa]